MDDLNDEGVGFGPDLLVIHEEILFLQIWNLKNKIADEPDSLKTRKIHKTQSALWRNGVCQFFGHLSDSKTSNATVPAESQIRPCVITGKNRERRSSLFGIRLALLVGMMMKKKAFFGSLVVMVSLMAGTSIPAAFADPGTQLQSQADDLRELQVKLDAAERVVESKRVSVHAKKEIMRQRERLIRKIEKDQRLEDKISDRDLGASDAARDARKVTAKDRADRIARLEDELASDEKELAVGEVELQQAIEARNALKEAARETEKGLRSLAKSIHEENCGKRKFFQKLGKGLADLGALVADVDNSKSERQEHEIQRILKSSQCNQNTAVSHRQMPTERPVSFPGSESMNEEDADLNGKAN